MTPQGRLSGAAACEQRISSAPTAKPAPMLSSHADQLRALLAGGFEIANRMEHALDRLIGTEPEKDSKCNSAEGPASFERELYSINESANVLLSRMHRIAQRLDSAV
jgi:hypothetical protein